MLHVINWRKKMAASSDDVLSDSQEIFKQPAYQDAHQADELSPSLPSPAAPSTRRSSKRVEQDKPPKRVGQNKLEIGIVAAGSQEETESLQTRFDLLLNQYRDLQAKYDSLEQKFNSLEKEHITLLEDTGTIARPKKKQKKEYNPLPLFSTRTESLSSSLFSSSAWPSSDPSMPSSSSSSAASTRKLRRRVEKNQNKGK